MIPAVRFRAKRRSGFARQRINKSGTFTTGITPNTDQLVTSWTPDGTYPGTVGSNGLKIVGTTASATLTAYIAWTGLTYNSLFVYDWKLFRNGVVVDTQPAGAAAGNTGANLSYTGALNADDIFDVRFNTNTAYQATVGVTSYIEVVP